MSGARRWAAMMLLAGVMSPASVRAQAGNPLPVPPETKGRTTSTPAPYERESAFKRKFEEERTRRDALEQELQGLRSKLQTTPAPAGAASVPAAPGSASSAVSGSGQMQPALEAASLGLDALKLDAPVPVPAPPSVKQAVVRKKAAASSATPETRPGDEPLVFSVSPAALKQGEAGSFTAVPLGSYVKARVLTGVEANTQEAYPVLLQLDYAFVGPNHTRIDLSHCFMVAKAKANLSTERVLAETQEISCVRSNNEIVAKPAKGYVAGEDSTFGVTGQLISHQGRVLLAAVLASLAKGAGEAVAAAQTSTEVVSGGVGGVASATNITGSKAAYVGGRAVTDAGSLIAQWYLDYAKQLMPAIAVGSGRDVWVVLLDTVRIPSLEADSEGSEE